MIQTYEILRSQINIINNRFEGQVFIQKIYSTAFYICLTLRAPGESWYLYLGRGSGYEGIWISKEKPEAFLRQQDTFLEYLRKHLSSTSWEGMGIDSQDRIISLSYAKWGHKNTFRFFYLGRKLYFSNFFYDPDKDKTFLYRSWDKKLVVCLDDNNSHFDEVGRKKLETLNTKSPVGKIENLLEEERLLAEKNKVSSKKEKFFDRKLKNIENDLAKVARWPELFEKAQSEVDFSAYSSKGKICGIKMNFSHKDHYKRRDEIFHKVKSLKKAENILKERLANTVKIKSSDAEVKLLNCLIPIKPFWNNVVKSAQNKTIVSNDYKIFQKNDFKMAIGLSAQGNDEMRKNWAKKDDFWFHLDGDKSAHIIVKIGAYQLDASILTIIGSAMLEYSKVEYEQADLIYTQVKNLKGIPGVAGSVNYKKVKRVRIDKNINWIHFFS